MLSEVEAIFYSNFSNVNGGFGLCRSLHLNQAGFWFCAETAFVILTVFSLYGTFRCKLIAVQGFIISR